MSASQEKKRRVAARTAGTDKKTLARIKAEKKAAKNKRIWTVVCIIAAVVLVAALVWNSNLFYKNFTALQVGDEKYTAAEVGFFYRTTYYSFVNTYSDYLDYIGLDTDESLSSQSYSDTETWADYFRGMAVDTLTNITVLWQEAQNAGFELDDDAEADLESQLETLSDAATENDYTSVDKFIVDSYGKGLDFDTVSELIRRSYIAQEYYTEKQDSFTYTDDELNEYYDENADTYDNFTYLYYYVDGSEDTDNDIDSETAMATAKETADSIIADGVSSADDFKAKVLEITGEDASESTVAGSSLSSDYSDWMVDASRVAGDTEVAESSSGYYVVYFENRDDNDYNTVNVRHILIKAEADDDGDYTDEAIQTAEDTAEELLQEWKDGDATEDSFAQLATDNSEDTGSSDDGGLYENVYKGEMVDAFNDWCFDETRQPGDTGIVFNEDSSYCGYHVIYFVGTGENYRLVLAEDDKRSDDYDAWYDEVSANYSTSNGFTLSFVE